MLQKAQNSFWVGENMDFQSAVRFCSGFKMVKLPDGIVTVHLDDNRFRGAYYFRGDKLVVTAFGMKESSADLEVLGGERGKAALNLAKLVLIDMVRDQMDIPDWTPELALQGTTTQIFF